MQQYFKERVYQFVKLILECNCTHTKLSTSTVTLSGTLLRGNYFMIMYIHVSKQQQRAIGQRSSEIMNVYGTTVWKLLMLNVLLF